ncbi:MAG: hypothetical protein KDA89_09640, partial [Planctomycetaceae bacterium]|nr:hypothetical protein [Planctomycetaceae bacterium]
MGRRIVFQAAILLLAGLAFSEFHQSTTCADEVRDPRLPESAALTVDGDIASLMVDGIDRFLLRKITEASETRGQYWSYDFSSAAAYSRSVESNRAELQRILGIRDRRVRYSSPELLAGIGRSAVVADTAEYQILSIRWPVLADPAPTASGLTSVWGEGLLLLPKKQAVAASVIALPDADQSPEQLCGLVPGVPPQSQFPLHLVRSGCRVVVPMLVSREREKRKGRANLTNREYIYRSAFELGRHLLGYEIQTTLAVVDWLEQDGSAGKIGMIGYGEGGLTAWYAAAVDERISAVVLSGVFGPRDRCWSEPLDRNIFGLLNRFDATETTSLILPRRLIVEMTDWPKVRLDGDGGGPGELVTPAVDDIRRHLDAAAEHGARLINGGIMQTGITTHFGDTEVFGSRYVCDLLTESLKQNPGAPSSSTAPTLSSPVPSVTADQHAQRAAERQQRRLQELDRHNQALLRESPFVREQFLRQL